MDSHDENVDFSALNARVELMSDVFWERMVAINTVTAGPLDSQVLTP